MCTSNNRSNHGKVTAHQKDFLALDVVKRPYYKDNNASLLTTEQVLAMVVAVIFSFGFLLLWSLLVGSVLYYWLHDLYGVVARGMVLPPTHVWFQTSMVSLQQQLLLFCKIVDA